MVQSTQPQIDVKCYFLYPQLFHETPSCQSRRTENSYGSCITSSQPHMVVEDTPRHLSWHLMFMIRTLNQAPNQDKDVLRPLQLHLRQTSTSCQLTLFLDLLTVMRAQTPILHVGTCVQTSKYRQVPTSESPSCVHCS